MRIERLVIGSSNPAKISEWTKALSDLLEVSPVSEFGDFPEPEENEASYLKNARQKASHYSKLTNNFTLAIDGGFEIDALGGWPAVKSRRLLPGDVKANDEELIQFVLEKLKGVPIEKRTVRLGGAYALSDPSGNIIFTDSAFLEGLVAEKVGPVLIPGYPFRSIHFIPKVGKTYAELSEKEMAEYSTKAKIMPNLLEFLLEYNHA